MTAFLKRFGIILIAIILIANVLSFISLWGLKQGSFYKPSFLANEVQQDDFDYIILGASTGLTSINTQVVDAISKTSGINLSIDDTNLPSQYLMLQHFLAQGKTTKICVLAPSVDGYNAVNEKLSDNDYRFLPYVSEPYVLDYYQQFSQTDAKLLALSKWQPMLGVAYFNAELFYPSLVSILSPQRHNRFDHYGNYTYPYKNTESSEILESKMMPLELNNEILERIRMLCDANDIKLVCYISPLKLKTVVMGQTDYEVINHSDVLDDASYFYDAIHVNSKGRTFVSEQFAKDIMTYIQK